MQISFPLNVLPEVQWLGHTAGQFSVLLALSILSFIVVVLAYTSSNSEEGSTFTIAIQFSMEGHYQSHYVKKKRIKIGIVLLKLSFFAYDIILYIERKDSIRGYWNA